MAGENPTTDTLLLLDESSTETPVRAVASDAGVPQTARRSWSLRGTAKKVRCMSLR